uniref:Uncharacterized protein n=1 Tax=Schistosoma haematobium TaxID=6185 RepID=A0A094ZFR1_SCHHA
MVYLSLFLYSIQYFIGYNRSLWFTVTPCTNLLNRIEFVGSSAYNEPWEENSVNWPQQKIRVEPFPSETKLPNFTLINQGDTILGLTRSRLHFTQIKYKTDSLNVRLYGNIGDAYNVRLSTRSSPKHALDGYPELDKTSTISVCLVQNTNDTLDISWKGVMHNSMQINYCVVINANENLYYECTAMSRLNQFFNYHTNEKFERPKIFQDTDYLRPKLIDNYKINLHNQTIFQIPSPFLQQHLRHYRFTNHRIKRTNYHQLYLNNKLKSKQINNYLMKTITTISLYNTNNNNNNNFVNIPNLLKRQFRNIPMKNGFQIGVECTSHQVYISLKIHVNPQNYWIYTLPVLNDSINNINLMWDYLNNNMTDYCEFPKHILSKQIKQIIKPIYCQTTQGMHSLELTIPAYHRNDYPRFYLILIYVSNNDDINGKYKQLFVRQLLDTCNIISNGCYPNVPTDCRQNYPKYLP